MRIPLVVGLLGAFGFASASPAVPSACAQDGAVAPPPAAPIGIVDAVRSTIAFHPMLQVQQKQVDISRAQKQQRSADFDTQLDWTLTQSQVDTPLTAAERSSAALTGLTVRTLVEDSFAVTGGAQRLLRSGIVVAPRLSMDRTADNMQNLVAANRTRLSVDLRVPLMRGKGREIVTAPETAAQIGVQASLYDVNQQIADLTLASAVSYWQYVASLKQLEIMTASEARAREFVDSVTTLVRADRLPRSEINQAQANLASRAASRIAIEQQVTEARSNLALAMGLAPERIVELPAPADAFPDGLTQAAPSLSPENVRALIAVALVRRADYISAEKKKEAADLLRRPATDGIRPQLDVILSGGYSSLSGGRSPNEFLISPFTNASGPDAVVGLRYSRPSGNNLALGQLAEAEASYQQAQLLATERGRVIANDVVNALSAVHSGIQRLTQAHEAVTGFQAALDGERDKLRLGIGSITDILTVEGRLTEALIDYTSAQQAYAVGVVQLRFASGTLVAPDQAASSIERDVFFEPPAQAYGR